MQRPSERSSAGRSYAMTNPERYYHQLAERHKDLRAFVQRGPALREPTPQLELSFSV